MAEIYIKMLEMFSPIGNWQIFGPKFDQSTLNDCILVKFLHKTFVKVPNESSVIFLFFLNLTLMILTVSRVTKAPGSRMVQKRLIGQYLLITCSNYLIIDFIGQSSSKSIDLCFGLLILTKIGLKKAKKSILKTIS